MPWRGDPEIRSDLDGAQTGAYSSKLGSWGAVCIIVMVIGFAVGLYWLNLLNDTLFHNAMETLIVVLASFTSILAIIIASRNDDPLFRIAAGCGGLALLSFAHMAYFAGVHSDIENPTRTGFELRAAYSMLEAAVLVFGVLPAAKRFPPLAITVASLFVATGLLATSLASEILPVIYETGTGHTSFGYAIHAVYGCCILIALFLIYKEFIKETLSRRTVQFLVLAVTANFAAEICLIVSDYSSFHDFLAITLKAVGLVLIAVPVVMTGILEPQAQAAQVRLQQRDLVEEIVRHSATLEAVLGAALDYVSMTDRDGRFLFVSRSHEHLIGTSSDNIVGKTWRELGLDPQIYSVWEATAQRVFETGLPVRQEVTNCDFKEHTCFEYEVAPVLGISGASAPMAVVTVCRDITARKEMEEELRALLEDNRLLLMEVHHRVKNNLQIISSILQMQAWRSPDAANRVLFEEAGGRILSLAKLHELLYKSGNFSHLEFGVYLKNLCRELFSLYGVRPDCIRLITNCEPVSLQIDKAVPMALIVHELITNCIKHAFNKNGGTIRINFRRDWDGRGLLSVADDGVGLSEAALSQRSGTLGLKMIAMLVRQLRGDLQQRHGNGTEFMVYFPIGPLAADSPQAGGDADVEASPPAIAQPHD